jgi:hypothetical protein
MRQETDIVVLHWKWIQYCQHLWGADTELYRYIILIVGVKRYFKVYVVIASVLLRTYGRWFLYLVIFSPTIAHQCTPGSFGGHGVRVANLFSFCVVLLCVVTFRVPRCDVRCDFRIKSMFSSSLPPIVCRGANVLFTLFVFACV